MPLYLDRRPNGIYRIRGTHHGVTVDKSARTRSAEQAEAIREKWEREIFDRHVLGKRPAPTFAELAEDYMRAGRDMGPKAEEILLAIGMKRSDEVTPADCDRLAVAIYPDAKPSTINRNIIAPISALMNWAAADDRAPMRKWPRRRERQSKTDWRRPSEIEAILAELNSPQARGLMAAYVGCGLRASEGVFLDGRDIAPDLSQITVQGTAWDDDKGAEEKGYEGTKGFYSRTVSIPPRAREFIAPVVSLSPGRALVNSRGYPWADRHALRNSLARACQRLGVPVLTPHTLRHTWATWHYAVHKDPMTLMVEGGWTKMDLVQRYAHLSDPSLKGEVLEARWAIDGQSTPDNSRKWNGNNEQAA